MPARDDTPERLGAVEDADAAAADNDTADDDNDDAPGVAGPSGHDDAESAASLEELLAQRAAASSDDDPEDDDLMALASERDHAPSGPIAPRVAPVVDQREFVCRRCHLVKARTQLADAARVLCRDCI